MISLEQLRIIDPNLNDLTDETLELVRSKLYEVGQFAFDKWLKTKAVPNLPLGLSQSSCDSYTIK